MQPFTGRSLSPIFADVVRPAPRTRPHRQGTAIGFVVAILRFFVFPWIRQFHQLDIFSIAFLGPCWLGTLASVYVTPDQVSGIESLTILSTVASLIFFSVRFFILSYVTGLTTLWLTRMYLHLPMDDYELLYGLILIPWLVYIIRYSVNTNLSQIVQYDAERKTIAGHLNSKQEQLSAILENSPLIMCVMDKEGVYVQSRGTGLEFLGLEQNEIVGQRYTEALAQYPDVVAAIDKAKSGKRSQVRAQLAPDVCFDVIYDAVKNNKDEVSGIIGVGIDVSSRVQMEQKERELERHLYQTQKEESLSTLAGGVAHDFNNYLMSIVGFCESLETESNGRLSPDTVRLIKKTALQAAGISKQMLVYASKDPWPKDQTGPIDLVVFFNETQDLLQAVVPKNIELTINVPQIEEVWTNVDGALLQQSILNLVKNSIDSIGDHQGKIRICLTSPKNEFLEDGFSVGNIQTSEQYCEIRIMDSGCGIEPDLIPRIFDLYYSTKQAGYGIGLAVTASIIQKQGGLISCSSRPGIGTTIQLLLPTSSKPAESKSETTDTENFSQPKSVLLVDDQKAVLMSISMMLESNGFRVYQASSGKSALEQIDELKDKIDCIILDFSMPQMNGMQLLKKIREARVDTPTIMCSGLPINYESSSADCCWPDATLAKPFRMRELCQTINRVCTP